MDKTLKSLTALITIILGTNDYINVINDEGVKIPLNKYVLLHTIPECFELFSLENPEVCKLTFFYHHRPRNVVYLGSHGTMEYCLCEICHNLEKILETSSISSAAEFQHFFQKKSSDIARDFLSNILCSEPTEQCFFRDCSECKDKIEQLQDELESIFDFFKVHSVTWECWDSTDRCEVTTFNNTPAKFCKVLMEKLTLYSEHFMIDKKQTKAFQTLKKELPLDSALIIGDFSMNYSFEES